MGGGESNSAPPSDVAPGGGTFPVDAYGNAYNPAWGQSTGIGIGQAIGKGISSGSRAYAQGVRGELNGTDLNKSLYRSGSGSPYVGTQIMSADAPSGQIAPPVQPNMVTDQQKQIQGIISQIYQRYQQRALNEGFGQNGQFGF